ncbi:MAG: hypothetical protein VR65_23125 [Desulfobulbaceae bacterium BRH_c16a]|nr:MAG: hypothetical protein VR65_23125 [Desulfobulbaceae bacterium BRH_c16a]
MKVKAKDIIHKHVVDDLDNESLTVGRVYFVIGIAGDSYRVVDDSSEPILYTKELFDVVDSSIPSNWVEKIFEGESYIDPEDTCEPGFYEDYFDGVPHAIETYNNLLKKLGIQSGDSSGVSLQNRQ